MGYGGEPFLWVFLEEGDHPTFRCNLKVWWGAPLPPSMGLTPGEDESLDTSIDHLTEAQEEEAIPEEVR